MEEWSHEIVIDNGIARMILTGPYKYRLEDRDLSFTENDGSAILNVYIDRQPIPGLGSKVWSFDLVPAANYDESGVPSNLTVFIHRDSRLGGKSAKPNGTVSRPEDAIEPKAKKEKG